MNGLALIKMEVKYQNIGANIMRPHNFVQSGLQMTIPHIGFLSTDGTGAATSSHIDFNTMKSCYGVQVRAFSAASTNTLWVGFSGMNLSKMSAYGIQVRNNHITYFEPKDPNKQIVLYSKNSIRFEFTAFGK